MLRRPKAKSQPAVCIVRHNYYPDSHVRRDAEALVKAGYAVSVIALRKEGQPAREILNGVEIHRLPVEHRRGSALRYAWEYSSFALLAFLRLTRLHLRKRFKVVEIDNMPDILVFSAIVPRLTGTPVILYIFDNMPELLAYLWQTTARHPVVRGLAFLERVSTGFASHIIVTQEAARAAVTGRGTVSEKVTVVLNCPDESVFRGDRGRRLQESNGFEIVTHGAILERYGIQVLIDAVAELSDTIPDVRLHIFGMGEYREQLEEQARHRGIRNIVQFHGLAPLSELLDHLVSADVGYAGMLCDLMLSNKLMEYVAIGTPAVVARWPTFQHYFPDDLVTYFDPGDAVDLLRALLSVYVDRGAARERAARALSRYQHYTWEVQREVYLNLYSELAGTGHGSQTPVEYSTRSAT